MTRAIFVLALFPTLALAQFSSNRGATCGVNLSCVSDTFTATTTTGSGFACNSALASCVDLGPGSCNSLGTNGSGNIVMGGTACSPTILIGGGGNITITGSNITMVNAGLDAGNNTTIMNTTSGKPVLFNDADGIRLTPYSATPTCNAGATGSFSVDTDDSRAYYCNGTASQVMALRGGPWSSALDFAVFAGAACQTLTFAASGAVLDEAVVAGGCGSVFNGDTDLTCEVSITATDVASVRLCCIDAAGCADLGSITFTATALR
jgi:hypothetical protein